MIFFLAWLRMGGGTDIVTGARKHRDVERDCTKYAAVRGLGWEDQEAEGLRSVNPEATGSSLPLFIHGYRRLYFNSNRHFNISKIN